MGDGTNTKAPRARQSPRAGAGPVGLYRVRFEAGDRALNQQVMLMP
ncbi:MAG TPA: hypothetical protein VN896_14795 [Methylomirabilota bacterium]|jgi:hypothetical protein|nr:hypothetical protein [Methylomirabilota bacterium]